MLLLVYAAIVLIFQYAALTRQILHDEVQDVITVEGLLYFDANQKLQLRQNYFSRPQSRLLVDRYMEVRDASDNVIYSSPTLRGMRLGGPSREGEGDRSFDERIIRLADGSHVFLISHIHGMDGKTLLIRLGYSLAPLRTTMLQFLLLLLLAIPLAIALAAITGQLIAKRALRPIDRLTERATQITATNLHDRLIIENSTDELGRMATAFNHLLGRLDAAFQQLGRFTSDTAHELRTPLAAIRTVGEVALGQEQQPETRKIIEDILEEAARLTQTVDSLLLLSQVEASGAVGQFDRFRLDGLLEELVALLSPMLEDSGVRIQLSCPALITVQADRSLLRIALLNILHNAWKFSPSQSLIEVSCHLQGESTIEISIKDAGPGITAEDHVQIFKRFYRGQNLSVHQQSGTGLGLSITKLILERCGGTIAFDMSITYGARCVVHLPVPPKKFPQMCD